MAGGVLVAERRATESRAPVDTASAPAAPPAPRTAVAEWQPVLAGRAVTRGRGRWVALAVLVLLLAVAGVAGWAYLQVRDHQESYDGLILPGVSVGGIDLAGMTAEQARAAVSALVAPELDRRLTLTLGDRVWETDPVALGSTSNVDGALAGALAAGRDHTFLDWARMRFQDATVDSTADVAVTHTQGPARALVESIAAELAIAPVDATMDWSSGDLVFTPGQYGNGVAIGATTDALVRALHGEGDTVAVQAITLAPAVTVADFGQVLYLDQTEHHLELWEHGQLIDEWTVAVGTAGYPTPEGEFFVELKRYLPSWINPAPDGWGASLPESIGPGPGNPLGVRALNWGGADAIRFHGTQAVNSLGTDASHGCVRMSNDEVIELYDQVDVGATIISVRT